MNDNGLGGEGKNIIQDIDKNESNFSENMTNYYNNDELVNNNKNTVVFSDKTTLNSNKPSMIDKFVEASKEKPKSNESNALYDFFANMKNNLVTFLSFKTIENDEAYNKKLDSAGSVTLIALFVAICCFIDVHGHQILRIIISALPMIFLGTAYYFFRKRNKKAILFAFLGTACMFMTFKVLNIIIGFVYVLGIITLLTYNKKTP